MTAFDWLFLAFKCSGWAGLLCLIIVKNVCRTHHTGEESLPFYEPSLPLSLDELKSIAGDGAMETGPVRFTPEGGFSEN
jgi:hypothetical protein